MASNPALTNPDLGSSLKQATSRIRRALSYARSRLGQSLLLTSLMLIAIGALAQPLRAEDSRSPFRGTIRGQPINLELHSHKRISLYGQSMLLGSITISLNRTTHTLASAQTLERLREENGSLVPEAPSRQILFTGHALIKSRGSLGAPRTVRRSRLPAAGSVRFIGSRPHLRLTLKVPRELRSGSSFRVHRFEVPLDYDGSLPAFEVSVRSAPSRALGAGSCMAPHVAAAHNDESDSHSGHSHRRAATSSTTRAVTVITDCDATCSRRLGGAAANDQIAEYINEINTIYPDELGLTLVLKKQIRRTSDSTYPRDITDSFALLQHLRALGPSLGSAATKHLVTGRDLDFDVLGLAYTEAVCASQGFIAYGLTTIRNSLLTPIVMAHEFGHNLGASHDVATGGIMSPRLSSSPPNTFSQFSRNEILEYITNNALSCLPELLPETRFSVSYQRTRLRARVTLPEGFSDCSLELYAGASRRQQRTLLLSRQLSNSDTRTIIDLTGVARARPLEDQSPRQVFLTPRVSCETGGNLEGPLRSIRISSVRANRRAAKITKQWIQSLKAQLDTVG